VVRFEFKSIDHNEKKVLTSIQEKKWKGIISANYTNEKGGEIYWYNNRENGFEKNLSLERLKEKYDVLFKRFEKMDLLRSSFLRIEDKLVHEFNSDKK
jgi:predicted secreted acid phosphatase